MSDHLYPDRAPHPAHLEARIAELEKELESAEFDALLARTIGALGISFEADNVELWKKRAEKKNALISAWKVRYQEAHAEIQRLREENERLMANLRLANKSIKALKGDNP